MTEDIKKACEVMAAGGIILYPTDTIWGIGCDATNEKAVQRVYELKRRADNKAMLVLMDSEAKLDRYVSDVPDIAWDLISVSDKPLTIIYSSAKNLATNLLGADGSVGIRITNEIKSAVDYIVGYRQDDMSKAAPSGIIKLGAGGLVQVIR